MTWNLWTMILAASCVLIVTYEIVAAARHSATTPTITGIVQFISRRPIVPFMIGLLMGHLFA